MFIFTKLILSNMSHDSFPKLIKYVQENALTSICCPYRRTTHVTLWQHGKCTFFKTKTTGSKLILKAIDTISC